MLKDQLELEFKYPPNIYGVYDTGGGIIYIFGQSDESIEDVISHESLHWTVQKAAGKLASLGLDNLPYEWIKVE